MNQEEFDSEFGYSRPEQEDELLRRTKKTLSTYYSPFSSLRAFLATFLSFFPIVRWLPKYDFRQDLMHDIIGGLTVGIMHVPQGIAYAVLSHVHPVVGLYTSFFPPLFYMAFGTSRHNSIGSFAVVSLMTGLAVTTLMKTHGVYSTPASFTNLTATLSPEEGVTPIMITSTLTLCIGIIQFLMAFLRLDFIATYFSDQLVAGFTTAAAFQVLVAQLKDVFDIKDLPERTENYAMVFLRTYDILANIERTNWYAFGISIASMAFLIFGKEFVNPFVKSRFRSPVPIPFELLLVIISTVISYVCNLNHNLDIQIVDHIPTGFPSPQLPHFSLIPSLIVHAFGIAAVIVAVHISLAKMFAKKLKYEVDARQELYAIGFSSIASGFFPVYPASTALGRSMVNVEVGSRTLVSTAFSSLLLVAMIAYLGQWLDALPMCVLSAIIIVALKGMFMKLSALPQLWKLSKMDFSIWVVSFVVTVAWDVIPGLAAGIIYALFTTVMRTQWPRWHILGHIDSTDQFRDCERYKEVQFFDDICVFRFDSPLLFVNVERFKSTIAKATDEWRSEGSLDLVRSVECDKQALDRAARGPLHLVIDCSGFTSIDCMGVNVLKEVFLEMKERDVVVSFAATKAPVRELFEASGFYGAVPKSNFFPTIRDAVAIAGIGDNGNL
ncbi:hypothetical protein QR680_005014 [Steinernema hermaphroditum]|uniref:STAS domain-containing protein n=1 Tax=Steinernema hermaphroditum TaxID=289476 RepID=A0AA39LUY1_9BILA|nr:hypothetical protein QR680_005014 [Steinernema hermaphroditum]